MSVVLPSGKYMPVFNKHQKSAAAYSSMVTGVNGQLDSAIGELNRVSSMLVTDKKGSNDLLTYNVAASSEEIKSEIEAVKSTISSYASALEGQAKTFDEQERNDWIALNKKRGEIEL